MQALDALLAKQDELIAYIDKKKKKKMVCNWPCKINHLETTFA